VIENTDKSSGLEDAFHVVHEPLTAQREIRTMKTWILCIEKQYAKVFARDEKNGQARLCYTLNSSHRSKNHFLKYIAEEMELACGVGTSNDLIVEGEKEAVKKITELFSHEVRSSIRAHA
jgi:hypothetical protein